MAHLIELISSNTDKLMIVNLDHVTSIHEYPTNTCKISLSTTNIEGNPNTLSCLESAKEIMCIANATNPMNHIADLIKQHEQNQKEYYENLITKLAKIAKI